MGHAPYAWSVLGAVSQVTERVELMTYVTCPIMRYHPAVVAQKAATVDLLSDGRFTLGLGAGENLNEHVVGRGLAAGQRPPRDARGGAADHHARSSTAATSTSPATTSGSTRPSSGTCRTNPVPIGVAVSGEQSVQTLRRARRPPDRGRAGRRAGQPLGRGERPTPHSRKIGQLPVCWGPDRDACIERAHELFRWFGGGWKVNAELPGPAGLRRCVAVRHQGRRGRRRSPAGPTSRRS